MKPADVETGVFGGLYRRIDWISGGGVADVFEAIDLAHGRTVAVKRMRGKWHGDERVEQHFAAEARALRALRTAPVAALLDSGHTVDGLPYLVLERLRGPTLAVWLESAPSLSDALAVFVAALRAIEQCHELGVLHGDIKPGNVMLSPDGPNLLLVDFGLAVVADDADDRRPRGFGTPGYLAPELVIGAPRTVSSEVYAAGAMLYEVLTGDPPFDGANPAELCRRQLSDAVVPPSVRASLPNAAALDAVAMRALSKQPELRFASIVEMRRAVARAAAGIEGERPTRRPGWDHVATVPYRPAIGGLGAAADPR